MTIAHGDWSLAPVEQLTKRCRRHLGHNAAPGGFGLIARIGRATLAA